MPKKLLLIIFIAAILRFSSLGTLPNGFNADEAALSYNAWSLFLTGKDEHAHPIPVNLESFGDYKPALYSYLLVPLVGVFGLSDTLARLPAAFMGVIAVAAVYALARQLVRDKSSLVPLCAAGYLALSPWHIHFSRGAWEVNVATTLLTLGTYAYIRAVRTARPWYLFVFGVCFVLAMYTYQSARLLAPALALVYLLSQSRFFIIRIRQFLAPTALIVFLALPLAISVLTSDATSRLNGVGLLADEGPLNRVKEFRGQYAGHLELLAKVLHNRPVIYSLQFVKNYLAHFDGNFLFVNGDAIDRSRVPETGLLYLTDSALIVFGLLALRRYRGPVRVVGIGWLFVAPLAAAATFQVPHALRAENMVIPLSLLIGLGLDYLYKIVSRYGKTVTAIVFTLFALLYGWQFARYWHEYSVHYAYDLPVSWQYGFAQVAKYLTAHEDKYAHIIMTDKYDQPYILFLYYLKIPPAQFQTHHVLTPRDRYNFSTVTTFGKYQFTSTNWETVRDRHSSLIIAAPEDIPAAGVNVIDTLYFPNGSAEFKIVAN